MIYNRLVSVFKSLSSVSRYVQFHAYNVLRLVNREIKTRPAIPLRRSVEAYRHGFVSASVPLFGLENDEYSRYLSDWQTERARRINGELAIIHENKLLFHYVLEQEFPNRLPNAFAYIEDGYRPLPLSSVVEESLRACVNQVGKVIVKPVGGALGDSIFLIERSGEGYLINEEPRTGEDVDHLSRNIERYVVTEFVEQADYSRSIYPHATNTIRIMTMVDPRTGEPFVCAVDHRFGTEDSKPVDNSAKGGVFTEIDLETGRLGKASTYPTDGTLPKHSVHPDSGARIEGVRIPEWTTVCEGVLEMAEYVAPMTPYVGWDVLITDETGEFVTIEANSYPDLPLQAYKPLLDDERTKSFYEHHGVV